MPLPTIPAQLSDATAHAITCPECHRRVTHAVRSYACPRCGALLADLYHRERNPPLHPGTLSLDQIRAEYAVVGMTMPEERPEGRMAA